MSKVRYVERKIQDRNHVTRLFISAAAGSVIGATAALLLAPKSGRKFRKDLYETYEDLSEKGQEFIDDTVKKGHRAARTAADMAENFKDSAKEFIGQAPEASNPNINLLIGAIGGGLLGAAAIYLLAPKGEEEEESFAQKVKSAGRSATENLRSVDWVETAKDIVETIHNKVSSHHHNGSEVEEEVQEQGHNKIHDVIEFASLGLRLWENIKKRR